MTRRLIALALALALPAVFAPDALATRWPGGVRCASTGGLNTPYRTGLNCRTFRFDGAVRRYVAWVPRGSQLRIRRGARLATVTMLHGSSGTGEQFFNISGWREKADREHFVAIFPTGRRYVIDIQPGRPMLTKWADFDLVDDIDETVIPPADDVGFLRQVQADAAASTQTDGRRAYIAGFSNGSKMCFRASLEMSDVYAAAACHAGWSNYPRTVLAGRVRLPLALSLGNIDDDAIAALQASNPGIAAIPMNPGQAFAINAISQTIAMQIASVSLAENPYRVVTANARRWTLDWATPLAGNTDGNDMSFTLLEGVTHEYPACSGRPRRCNNPHNFNAPDMVWPFLHAHLRP